MLKLFLIQNSKLNIMKFYFYFVLVLHAIISVSILPSEDLWNKTLQYISEGKMKTFGKSYFIFDEENYTALNINSSEMEALYDKQKDLYNSYSLRSFLFICKNLNRTIQDAYSIRDNMRDHLISFGTYINNTVFVLISVESNESILYTGSLIRKSYISDNAAVILNNDIKQSIKNKEYYEALENFLIDIEDYFIDKNTDNDKGNGNNKNSSYIPTRYYSGNSDSPYYVKTICEVVFPILFLIGIIFYCCHCKKRGISYNSTNNNNNNNNDRNSSIGGYSGGGNYSVGGNSYSAPSYSAPSYGGNSIGGASGGAI